MDFWSESEKENRKESAKPKDTKRKWEGGGYFPLSTSVMTKKELGRKCDGKSEQKESWYVNWMKSGKESGKNATRYAMQECGKECGKIVGWRVERKEQH